MSGKTSGLPIRIAVTPLMEDANGTAAACEIEEMAGASSHVKGGVIKLKSKTPCTLSFEIQQSSEPGAPRLNFAATGADAFWCREDCCPTDAGVGGFLSNPQVLDSKTLTVDAAPPNGNGMMFYRLNFDDGSSYDPIIIHN